MTLQSKRELEVTREKLRGLERLYAEQQAAPAENPYARELTLRSLRRTINQLKEEITRFEARTGRPPRGSEPNNGHKVQVPIVMPPDRNPPPRGP